LKIFTKSTVIDRSWREQTMDFFFCESK